MEDDPAVHGDGAFSSPGAFGFYPWIDSSKSYYGIISRQQTGELDPAIDPRYLLTAMMATIAAPVVMPDLIGRLWGTDATDPRFQESYVQFVRDLAARLGPRQPRG